MSNKNKGAQTAAFQAPAAPNAFRQSTSLNSEVGTRGVSLGSPAATLDDARALESRLNALEQGADPNPARSVWGRATSALVQGGSLKTWSFTSNTLERLQVVMRSDGRPVDAEVELWHGPDNTPIKMRVYLEDGNLRQFSALMETPKQGANTVAIRNIANLEFPVEAAVTADNSGFGVQQSLTRQRAMTVQGGALRTYPFDPLVDSVQVLLMTDGRPLQARVELLQGPNNNKQVIEIYTEDGYERPFYAVLETPGSGNVVRVVNTATVEFPLTAWVEPYAVGNGDDGLEPVLSGDPVDRLADRFDSRF